MFPRYVEGELITECYNGRKNGENCITHEAKRMIVWRTKKSPFLHAHCAKAPLAVQADAWKYSICIFRLKTHECFQDMSLAVGHVTCNNMLCRSHDLQQCVVPCYTCTRLSNALYVKCEHISIDVLVILTTFFAVGLPAFLRFALKVLFQTATLFWVILRKTRKPSHILIQVRHPLTQHIRDSLESKVPIVSMIYWYNIGR